MSENILEKYASELSEAREWGARVALNKLASKGLLKEEVLAKVAEEDATTTLEMVKEAGILEGSIATANNIIELLRANPEKTAMEMADAVETAGNEEMAGMDYNKGEGEGGAANLPPEVIEAAEVEAVAGAAEVVAVASGLPAESDEVVDAAKEIVTEAAPAEGGGEGGMDYSKGGGTDYQEAAPAA